MISIVKYAAFEKLKEYGFISLNSLAFKIVFKYFICGTQLGGII